MIRARDPKRYLVWHWLPPALWCAIIFIQSSFATPDTMPDWPYMDKIGHTGVYALLAFLFARAFHTIESWDGSGAKVFVAGVAAATIYGALDEWHQSFVVVRSADLLDLLADFAGAVLGASFFLWARSRWWGRFFR